MRTTRALWTPTQTGPARTARAVMGQAAPVHTRMSQVATSPAPTIRTRTRLRVAPTVATVQATPPKVTILSRAAFPLVSRRRGRMPRGQTVRVRQQPIAPQQTGPPPVVPQQMTPRQTAPRRTVLAPDKARPGNPQRPHRPLAHPREALLATVRHATSRLPAALSQRLRPTQTQRHRAQMVAAEHPPPQPRRAHPANQTHPPRRPHPSAISAAIRTLRC